MNSDITAALARLQKSDARVVDTLIQKVYDALHTLAQRQLLRERSCHTLSPTALVNEAYLKLVDQRADWRNRAHFLAVAARVMRRILINHATRRYAAKRGGGHNVVALEHESVASPMRDEQILHLNQAIERLAQLSQRQARVVEMRFFGGLTHEEVAAVLGVSTATAKLDWRLARAWLSQELQR